jgi:hypothetical protein
MLSPTVWGHIGLQLETGCSTSTWRVTPQVVKASGYWHVSHHSIGANLEQFLGFLANIAFTMHDPVEERRDIVMQHHKE